MATLTPQKLELLANECTAGAEAPAAQAQAVQGLQTSEELVAFVQQPTWKEILLELVAEQKLDVKAIDVAMLANTYLSKVRELQSLDLRLPANIILACALLLFFKSLALLENRWDRWEASAEACSDREADEFYYTEEIPELLALAGPRRRTLTLDELIKALESALSSPIRALRALKPQRLELRVKAQDAAQRIEDFYALVLKLFSKKGYSLPFSVIAGESKEHYACAFLLLLHLMQGSRLAAWQSAPFEEIFVTMAEATRAEATRAEATRAEAIKAKATKAGAIDTPQPLYRGEGA